MGWQELKNGKLLDAAEQAGFEVMVTCERNLKFQQNFTGRSIAIVVLPSGRWPAVKHQIDEAVEAVDQAQPGSYREIAFRKPPRLSP